MFDLEGLEKVKLPVQEFEAQGLTIEAIFIHEVSPLLHIGIAIEDDRFIVFYIENGSCFYTVANMWDEFVYAHKDFMKLYELKRKES